MNLSSQRLKEHLLTGEAWEVLKEVLWDYRMDHLRQLRHLPSLPTSEVDKVRGRLDMLDDLLQLRSTIREYEEARKIEAERARLTQQEAKTIEENGY